MKRDSHTLSSLVTSPPNRRSEHVSFPFHPTRVFYTKACLLGTLVNPQIACKIQHYDLEDVSIEIAHDFLRTMLRVEKAETAESPLEQTEVEEHGTHSTYPTSSSIDITFSLEQIEYGDLPTPSLPPPTPSTPANDDSGMGFFNVRVYSLMGSFALQGHGLCLEIDCVIMVIVCDRWWFKGWASSKDLLWDHISTLKYSGANAESNTYFA